MTVRKDVLLQRPADVEISVRQRQVRIQQGNRVLSAGDYSLALMQAFATPKTLEQGLSELAGLAPGRWSWMKLAAEARLLAAAGLLLPVDDVPVELLSHPNRLDGADVHIRMLDDVARTECFREALRRQVTSEDIVVDVGTGTGILAASAAQAGARHVYAIERSPNLAKLARRFFAENGLEQQITVIEGASTEVSLPERADIMVSEIIGNDPLAEGVVSTAQDARARLLKPDARLIPSVVSIHALPLEVPDAAYSRHFFTEASLGRWRESYGLDFSVFREVGKAHAGSMLIPSRETRKWPRFCEALEVAKVDLTIAEHDNLAAAVSFTAQRSGELNGVLIYFELDMAPGLIFSLHPDQATSTNSWANKVWLPAEGVQVKEGEQWQLTYRYDRNQLSQFSFERLG